jgi:hypothetical protein
VRSWSPSAEQKLRELYGKQPLPRIAFLLKRTEIAVRSRAKLLGLVTGKVQRWSAKERKLLRRFIPILPRPTWSKYSIAQGQDLRAGK